MQTMTIQYNPSNALVQPIIELIQQVKGIKIISRSDVYVPNEVTKAAMREAREGNLKTYSNVDEMMNDILG
ncbi:MAG: hypothetical protein IKP93_01265 [Paludibacteraceae bacterium]|nr:hypothetical protein [Paludibacteraceae bacterium]